MFKLPFNPVSGQGLGVSYSSLNQLGEIFPQCGIGQAKLKLFTNITTGNMILFDLLVKVEELNGPLKLGYVYNSMAAQPWQFAIKRFTQLPNQEGSPDQTALLCEEDGYLTTYTSVGNGIYRAQALADGTPYIYFNSNLNYWIWFHPRTQIVEYYNLQGLLIQRLDAAGRATTFSYDQNSQIQTTIGPTGNTYQILRANNTIQIIEIVAGVNTLLQSYTLDNQGRILSTQTPDGYVITYKYSPSGPLLNEVDQSDGTQLVFNYLQMPNGQQKLNMFRYGAVFYRLNYLTENNQNSVEIQNGVNSATTIALDSQGRIANVTQQTGYDATYPVTETTTYAYTSQGQLQTILAPNGGQTTFQYDLNYGVLTQKTGANNQVTQWNYYADAGLMIPYRLISQSCMLNGQALTTYYIYDTTVNSNCIFLRFKITPNGRVTEYREDIQFNIANERNYLNDYFDLSVVSPTVPISLQQLEDWVKTVDPSAVSLIEYIYNDRGQVVNRYEYASIDNQGDGIDNAQTGFIEQLWDCYGNQQEMSVLQQQSPELTSLTTQRFDGLQRLTKRVDAENNLTSFTYQSINQNQQAQYLITTLLPNERSNSLTLGYDGFESCETDSASSNTVQQTRTTTWQCDAAGRAIITALPDGNLQYTFYDRQNRLGFKVTSCGIVTQYQYDNINNYRAVTLYNANINPTSLYITPPQPGLLPTPSLLAEKIIPEIANPAFDRVNYEFYDYSNRKIFTVDAVNVVTQTIYDAFDRISAEITYNIPLSSTQLNLLLQGQAANLNLTPNFVVDRCTRYFYDNDNNKIAMQDSAGYVTETLYDAGNRAIKKIMYATPVAINLAVTDFNSVRPESSSNDAINYYFYDARGKCVIDVDAAGYVTASQYLACALLQQTTRYANPVDPAWLQNPTQAPNLPSSSGEDQVSVYTYDSLNRISQVNNSNGCVVTINYDEMGNILAKQTVDGNNLANITPDFNRSIQALYDEWDQTTNEANNYVSQLITQINADSNLTPQQKQTAILQVWQTQSTRIVYDASGLKLKSTDSYGNTTFYYYDLDCRLVVSIDPNGSVLENTLNSAGEISQKRAYVNAIPAASLATLTGGPISAIRVYLNSLQDAIRDQITAYIRDQRGQIIQITDPEGYVTINAYNSFKQIFTELKPVSSLQPSLLITHVYEARGLEIQTLQTAGNTSLIVARSFANIYGKVTQYTDANGNQFQTIYDNLGRIITQIDPYKSTTFSNDSFGRVLTETDVYANVITHTYNQQLRTHTIQYPISGVYKVITFNVFNEKITERDALNNTQAWTHAADGQIATYCDPNNNVTCEQYDLLGRKILHIDANLVQTSNTYDPAGNLITNIYDVGGLHLITTNSFDAFRNCILIIDPKHINTNKLYDRRNLSITIITDPSNTINQYNGLNLITTQIFNGQATLCGKIQGDANTLNQYEESYLFDGFNRNIGKIIDPNNLKLATNYQLDANGKIIVETDANGHSTYKFYDSLECLRFTIDAAGGVKETNYNLLSQIFYTRNYQNAIDVTQITPQTTLSQIIALIQTDLQDTCTWFFYDQNGNQRFKITNLGNNQGAISETRYDLAIRQVETIQYANSLDITTIATWTTSQIVVLVAGIQDAANDRVSFFMLDAAGQQRYLFDPIGAVTEQRYDALGRVITRIKYATLIANPAQWALLSLNQVAAQLILDPLNDQYSYQFFDSRGKPQFVVDSECYVTSYIHDANGNMLQQIQFANAVAIPNSYPSLLSLLLALVPNPLNDRVVQRGYDTANRQIALIDALNHTDTYLLDARGNISNHVDRNNNTWNYVIDTANRVTDEITPPILLTSILQTNNNNAVQLSYTQQSTTVIKHTVYDGVGNKLTVIQGYNGNEARTMSFTYTVCNTLSGTSIANVTLDNPVLAGSFTTPPTQTATLTTNVVYNAKQQKVAYQNENGDWRFKIYDACGRKIYKVDEMGAVIAYVYNNFNEVIQEIRYAIALTIDLSSYTATGIPLAIMQQNLVTSNADKITQMQRDQRGDIILTTSGISSPGVNNVFYYNAKLLPPASGYANPQTQQVFDAFRRCVVTQKLTNPSQNPAQWVASFTWYNRVGSKVAECDAIARIKLYSYDAFRNIIQRYEYANPPLQIPTSQTTLAQFIASLQVSAKDRIYQMTFDVIGQQLTETLLNNSFQTIALDPVTNVPSIINQPVQNSTVSYLYSNTQQQIAIIYEDASTKYSYFNARGDLIATTDVPRVSQNSGKQTLTLVPLTYFGVNSFGQTVMTTRFKQGTLPANPAILPLPIALDPDDQCELSFIDNRGQVSYKQDADLNVTGFTYIAAKHLTAREYSTLTFVQPSGQQIKHIDEKRFLYDAVGNTLQVTIYRDNQIQQMTQSQFDVFHRSIAEGPGNNVWAIQRFYDACDNCWKSNDKNSVWTIHYFDLLGFETNTLVSASEDLSGVTYLGLPGLLQQSFQGVEQTISQRDEAGRLLQRLYPAYLQPTYNDIPLNISVLRRNGKLSLQWSSPHEENTLMELKIVLYPLLQTTYPLNIEYDASADCYFADLSHIEGLKTSKYQFILTYSSKINSAYIHAKSAVKQLKSCGDIFIDTQINSDKQSTEAFSTQTVDFDGTIKFLDQYVELQLNLDPQYTGLSVKIVCHYQSQDGKSHLHVDTVDTRKILVECIDSKDQVLYCNLKFKYPISTVFSISMSLVLDSKSTLFPLLVNHKFATMIAKPSLESQKEDLACAWELIESATKKTVNVLSHAQIQLINIPRKSVLFVPLKQKELDSKFISFLNTSKGRMATWSQYPVYGVLKSEDYYGILLDVTQLHPGLYPFKYGSIQAEFKVGKHAVFCVGDNKGADILLEPKRSYVYDAWDKKLTEIDGLGNVSQYTYTLRGAIANFTQPPVVVVNANGTTTVLSPQWVYAYDLRGYKMGVLDPNGNTTADLLDSAGQIISKVLADGTVLYTQIFDALGRIYNYYDSRTMLWTKTYNHHDYVLSASSPLNNVTLYNYDEQQHRIFVSLPGGMNYYYNYDPCNNMQLSFLPLLQSTQYIFERNHQLVYQLNPDGSQLTWQRNYWGYATQHVDLSGANYSYIYDFKSQKVSETSFGGNHGRQLVFAGIETKHKHTYTNFVFGNVGGENTQYIYAAGHLLQINNIATGSQSNYVYDLESRPIQLMATSSNMNITRYVTTTLDAIGREVALQDSFFSVTIGYDAVENRRMLIPSMGFPAWNLYDVANRIILYAGALENGIIRLQAGQSMSLAYTQNFRTVQIQPFLFDMYTSTLAYSDDGLLTTMTTHRDGAPANELTQSIRTYTPANLLHTYVQTGPVFPPIPYPPPVLGMSMTYDENGWTFTSACVQGNSLLTTQYENYNDVGLPTNLVLSDNNPAQTDNLVTYYTGFDEWQPSLVTGSSGPNAYTSTMLLYDVNGNNAVKLIQGAGAALMTSYMVTADGLTIMSSQVSATENLFAIQQSGVVCIEGPQNPNDTWYFYSMAGQPIASYSTNGSNYSFSLVNYIQAVSDSYPPPTPPFLVTGAGMTLSGIAAAVYGDPNFATQIGYANDFTSNDNPPVGYTLQLPQFIAQNNQADDGTPYEIFLATILGSLYAGNSLRIAQKRRHVSELEEIAGAIIIGALGLVSGGVGLTVAAVAYGTEEGWVVGSLVEAAIAGLTNAVIQGVAIGLGMQESFSYRGVLGAAAIGAMTGDLQVSNLLPNGSKDSLAVLLFKNGMLNALEQLTEMAAGQQKQFDIRALLSAMVVQSLGQKISFAALQKYQTINSSWLKKILTPNLQQATVSVGESILDSTITKQYATVEKNLLQGLGAGIGNYLGDMALNSAAIQNLQLSIENYLTAANDNSLAVQSGLSRYGLFSRNSLGIFNQASNASSASSVNDAVTNLVRKNSTTNNGFSFLSNNSSAQLAQAGVLGGDVPISFTGTTGVNVANDPIWNLNPDVVETLFSQVSSLPQSQQSGFIKQWMDGVLEWENAADGVLSRINQEDEMLIPKYSTLIASYYSKALASNNIDMFNTVQVYEQKLKFLLYTQAIGDSVDLYNRLKVRYDLFSDLYNENWKKMSEDIGEYTVGQLGSKALGLSAGFLGLELSPPVAIGLGIGVTVAVQPAFVLAGKAAGDDVYDGLRKVVNSL